MGNENVKLAYGIAYSSSAKGYLGAILITDFKGFPLEFKYTDPIVPTKIQQILYEWHQTGAAKRVFLAQQHTLLIANT